MKKVILSIALLGAISGMIAMDESIMQENCNKLSSVQQKVLVHYGLGSGSALAALYSAGIAFDSSKNVLCKSIKYALGHKVSFRPYAAVSLFSIPFTYFAFPSLISTTAKQWDRGLTLLSEK